MTALAPTDPAAPVALAGVDTSPDELEARRTASLALLDTLQAAYLPKAETGDTAAAALVLAILKHRAALLGLVHSPAPALRVAATSSPTAPETGDLKLVVEYVNDWREVLRRRS